MDEADERVRRRADFSIKHFRPSVDASIRQHDPNLWNRVHMLIRNITDRYVNSDNPISVFEVDLHDLWYLLIETAKITPTNEATADRLVNQVFIARELGHSSRLILPPNGASDINQPKDQQSVRVESAITSTSARMWIDLPFIVTDLGSAWANSIGNVPTIERENLAGFTARLTASGICDPQLTSCALMLFREALETPRRILESDEAIAADQAYETPISDFLPAVLAWLWYGSYKIFSLCAQNYVSLEDSPIDEHKESTAVGELLATSEGQMEPGFNMPRWQFWKHRLQGVQKNAEDKSVAEQGRKCVHIMESWEQITGGRSHNGEIARNAFFRKKV